ncbi:MAG TPA: hypothetical protein PKN75_00655 [Bacteroidia bacterium]|nr:hypothetical protein [Bacteroidia bacterium]HNU32082.1 hypothetical protein [Bacteroidia bacterium]
MRFFLGLISSITISNFLFGQQSEFPKGGYATFEELREQKPSVDFDFIVRKRDTLEIRNNRGNDYELLSTSGSISKAFIKKRIFAVSTGDSLFINCNRNDLQKGYAYAFLEGKYVVFNSAIPKEEIKQMANNNGLVFGIIGGVLLAFIVTETKLHNHAMLRFPFVLDMSNGAVFYLERYRLLDFLNQKPKLKEKYLAETNKDSPDVILDYIKQLNESLLQK